MSKSIFKSAIGKYVIIRSRNEGVNAGKLIAADETGCVIKNARRLWYSKPADPKQAWYEGVANSGLHSESKVSPKVNRKYIVEDYSITECSVDAAKSIKSAPSHES
jgi:hypothetical protein